MRKRRLLESLKDAAAFIITIVFGIGFGYLYTAVEALDDKLKPRHHSEAKHMTHHR